MKPTSNTKTLSREENMKPFWGLNITDRLPWRLCDFVLAFGSEVSL